MPYYDYGRGIGKGLEAIAQAISAVQGMKVQIAAQKAKMEYDEQQQRNEFNQRLELTDREHKLNLESLAKQNEYNLSLNKLREVSDFNQKIVKSNYDKGYVLKSGIVPDNNRVLTSDDFVIDSSNPENRIIDDTFLNSSGLSAQQQKLLSPYKGFPIRNAKEALQQAYYMAQQESLLDRQIKFSNHEFNNAKALEDYKQGLDKEDDIRELAKKYLEKLMGGTNKNKKELVEFLSKRITQNTNLINSLPKEGKENRKQRDIYLNEIKQYKADIDSIMKNNTESDVLQNIDPSMIPFLQSLGIEINAPPDTSGTGGGEDNFFGDGEDFIRSPVTNDGFIGPMPLENDTYAQTALTNMAIPDTSKVTSDTTGVIIPPVNEVAYTAENDPFGYYKMNNLTPPGVEAGLEGAGLMDPVDWVGGWAGTKFLLGINPVSVVSNVGSGAAKVADTMFPSVKKTASGIGVSLRNLFPQKPHMSDDSIAAMRELGQEVRAGFENRTALLNALRNITNKKQADIAMQASSRAAKQAELESAFANYDDYARNLTRNLYDNEAEATVAYWNNIQSELLKKLSNSPYSYTKKDVKSMLDYLNSLSK